ncbi:nitroreductase [Aequitasia blattaphilus]|uniref:Nitroreductase family protein n=1 Tax=Aequitasia blattaphilus TaxID=2949332 RepID=A0ABT1EAI0_9FIRM|nr:nitroreductase family protein [Aequitasia blattaphilus]MCP1102686.1 nitroreductase family protein [Aequitasia blattaphilus]MCR8615326.1 nitroreductase family protein [Aequitasia blattaphilus]
MEYFDLISKRQSIRKYKEEGIPRKDIEKILDAARIAPSGKNLQNWRFFVLDTKENINLLCQVIADKNEEISAKLEKDDEEAANRFRKFCKNFTLFIKNAPVVILTLGKDYLPSGYHEMKKSGASEEELNYLAYKPNPGMQNIGAAMEHMTLAATDLGYGSCWLTSANYAGEEIVNLIKEKTGFDEEGFFFTCLMSFGVPADVEHKSPKRKELEDICYFVD